jgi:alpha-D-ribose 1-methylphosphonate 5-triphosphate synthase subunit PhnI
MYVAAKGGEKAIAAAHRLLAEARRGDPAVPEISLDQIAEQLSLAVDRVMAEGSLYDRELAALAIKQARGDLVEAVFLLRAYRTTLPRLALSRPIGTDRMLCRRRISAVFKDLPGGQLLGPTFDYTHRLLDFDLAESAAPHPGPLPAPDDAANDAMPRVLGLLDREGLIEDTAGGEEPAGDQHREYTRFNFHCVFQLRLVNLDGTPIDYNVPLHRSK